MNKKQHGLKEHLFAQFARIGQAVASPQRLELLDLLAQGERRVDDLAREADLPVANASQHLQVLRRAQLVAVRRDGTASYYRLADERVFRLCQALRELGEVRLAEVQQLADAYLTDRSSMDAVDAVALWKRITDDDVVVVDVRPSDEFAAGHLPTARSIPLAELARRLHELPRERQIVAYCRGPYCVFADEAVALLTAHGYRAARLTVGFPDWQVAGLPVER